jgi:hypothetical protein
MVLPKYSASSPTAVLLSLVVLFLDCRRASRRKALLKKERERHSGPHALLPDMKQFLIHL